MGVDLAELLRDRWEAARAAWPGVVVPEPLFVAHVRDRLDGDAREAIHAIDLYLACGCAHGCAGAIETLDRAILARIAAWTRRIDPSPAFADEVAQITRAKLLVTGDGEPGRIAAYTGRGPLAGWVRIAAIRSALNLQRDRRGHRERELDDAHRDALLEPGDPELDYLRARYRPELQAALRGALAALAVDHRTVLRLHLCAGLTTRKIAAMYQVSQPTVMRWLSAARAAIRAAMRDQLKQRLGVTTREFESLAALLLSQLDVDLSAVLA
jgi:RNA polymerase sigma-70 factor (ECF subfamily)